MEILDPDRRIIDPHHHLFDTDFHGVPAFPAKSMADTIVESGHNVVATVYVETGAFKYNHGPEHLKCLGETEYANAVSIGWTTKPIKVCSGIVSSIDLTVGGDEIAEAIDEHLRISPDHLKGVRQISAWHEDPALRYEALAMPPGALATDKIQGGLRLLGKAGLSFDAWVYHTQLEELCQAVHAAPDTQFIIDHCGTPLSAADFATKKDEVYDLWARQISQLAGFENVAIKLGGIFSGVIGFSDDNPDRTAASIAQNCFPWFDHGINAFGAERCMFESNFPVDRLIVDYRTLWNSFKLCTKPFTDDEKDQLFFGTANRIYELGL